MAVERGINLAGELRPEDLDTVAAAGFGAVRLPVRWPDPFDVAFLDGVAETVEAAWERGLPVALTAHHEPEPERLTGLWPVIAERFTGAEELTFELLNEPRIPDWDALLPRLLAAVRKVDPARPVVVGAAGLTTAAGLLALELPDDPHLIATFHYYEPFRFTHQGASWEAGSDAWLGTSWGTEVDRAAVTEELERTVAWARERGVPLFAGEFGTFERADFAARVRWTAWVRRELERLGIPWAYWDFATDFGAYDRERGGWREDLLAALVA